MTEMHSGMYRKDDGTYVPIRAMADKYDARYEDRSKGYANRRYIEIRGAKPHQIENRRKLRKLITDPDFCSVLVYRHMMHVLDVFAREAGARIEGTSK